jgi:hypothetical protein
VEKCLQANEKRVAQPNPDASRVFGSMVDAGSGCYLRVRDLPRLIATLAARACGRRSEGSLLSLSKLRRALRAERQRVLAGHWSYELNRHLGLITTYKAELGLMRRAKLRVKRNAPGAARSTSGAPGKDDDASPAFHQLREPTR